MAEKRYVEVDEYGIVKRDSDGEAQNSLTLSDIIKARTKCEWTYDEDMDTWETLCGNSFTITDGTPTDNSMKYCCYCGKEIETCIKTTQDYEALLQGGEG